MQPLLHSHNISLLNMYAERVIVATAPPSVGHGRRQILAELKPVLWQVGGSSGYDSPVASWLGILCSLGNRAQVQPSERLCLPFTCAMHWPKPLSMLNCRCCVDGLRDGELGRRFWVQFRWWQANEISNLAGTISYIFALILWATSFEWVR